MNKISIGFTGDFCPIGRTESCFFQNTWKELFQPIRNFFEGNDLNIIDLECPLTESSIKIEKTGPHLKGRPETAVILKYLNCNVVATANNHFKDYGRVGMIDTYNELTNHEISWIGSGLDLGSASKPYSFKKNGLKISFLNMTEHEWSIAASTVEGCNPIDFPYALRQIQNSRATGSDFVVVMLHGGHEHYPFPSPRMKEMFRFMVDAGADAVIGHHTHIISGFEIYKGKPIFYGLGNFCFDYKNIERESWHYGMLLQLIFEKGNPPKFEYSFIQQNTEQVGLRYVNEEKRLVLESEISEINKIILNDNLLQNAFEEHAQNLKAEFFCRIQPYSNRYLLALYRRGLIPGLMNRSKRNMIKILAQCESHREVLINSLS